MKHPYAGGAEVVNEELAKRLVNDGHEVKFIVAGYSGSEMNESRGGFSIVRLGNRWTVYWRAYKYYKNNLIGWADLVIDGVTAMPFFTKFFVKERTFIFVHNLARQIWFYQIYFPFNIIGYILEPLWLLLINDQKVVTISQSTKNDLLRFGFGEKNIHIISEGIDITPVHDLQSVNKFEKPTILSFGALRPMKRTKDVVKAFEIAKNKIPELQLIVAGDDISPYGKRVKKYANNSKYNSSIQWLGKVQMDKKIEMMQKSHLIAVTSVKEGWGLIVTEANSQGTPAVVYNVDGLRDSVRNEVTGLVCKKNNAVVMAENFVRLINDRDIYNRLRLSGWEWSKEVTFERSYGEFFDAINNI